MNHELPGGLFVDPKLPVAGYAIAAVGGSPRSGASWSCRSRQKQDATLHDDVAGLGNGFAVW